MLGSLVGAVLESDLGTYKRYPAASDSLPEFLFRTVHFPGYAVMVYYIQGVS